MALTEKMKRFCREYVSNGGNATQAYLAAYDSNSEVSAAQEGYKLLQDTRIKECIQSLNAPLNDIAMDEGEKIRRLLWERIELCQQTGDESAIARYLDQLNRMAGRYTNISVSKSESTVNLGNLDINALKTLTD